MTNLTRAAALTFPLVVGALLSGCATLPSSGPTAHQIVKRADDENSEFRFSIVSLNSTAVEALNAAQSQRLEAATRLTVLSAPLRRNVLGAGDVLQISLFEVGVTLFSAAGATSGGLLDPSAHAQKFPEVTVNEDGTITLPYVGTMRVAGETPDEVEGQINRQFGSKSQQPQAMVTIVHNIASTTIVAGDVRIPGRYELPYGHERLLETIALAGGASSSSEDTLVRFKRGDRIIEERLDTIRAASPDNLVVEPGDYIELIKRPRSFTVFGATGKVSQVSFDTGGVSLAEALARVQGPSDATADPTAIFIFRYDDTIEPKAGSKPVIYRLNLMDPASYFLAQHVAMQDKDVIYIANAAANQPSKLIGILNQLFSPFVTAKVLTNGL